LQGAVSGDLINSDETCVAFKSHRFSPELKLHPVLALLDFYIA